MAAVTLAPRPYVAAPPPPAPVVKTAAPVVQTQAPVAAPIAPAQPAMHVKPLQVAIASAVGVTLAALCFAFIPFGWAALLLLLVIAPATIAGALWGSEANPAANPKPVPARAPSPKTTALDTPSPSAAPARALQPPKPVAVTVAKEQTPYEKYCAMVTAAGGTLPTEERPTVIGIRAAAPAVATDFHDKFIVLRADGTFTEFDGSTYPAQRFSSGAKDADKNGVPDVGIVRPGNYAVDNFHVTMPDGNGNVPGWRDTDHDGVYSDDERAASERRGDIMDQILFHAGATDTAAKSIGCMNLPPSKWPRFRAAAGAHFNYTLISAR